MNIAERKKNTDSVFKHKHRKEHNLTLRESTAARGRAQPRRQPGCRHRAVQRQQRQSRAAPELHRHPARPNQRIHYRSMMRQHQAQERNASHYLEKDEARWAAAAAARAAEGADRVAAAERPAAEATRAAARKQVEAMSPRRPATETAERERLARGGRGAEENSGARFWRPGNAMRACGGGGATGCRIRMVRFPWRRGMGVMGRGAHYDGRCSTGWKALCG